MKIKLNEYKTWLEKELKEAIEKPKSYSNFRQLSDLLGTIHNIDEYCENLKEDYSYDTVEKDGHEKHVYAEGNSSYKFTPEMASAWVSRMQNDDGTTGAHWTMQETNDLAKRYGVEFNHITEYCWNTAMNMIYSDYCQTLKDIGADRIETYVKMSADFLFDKDSVPPSEKLYWYYTKIVKH